MRVLVSAYACSPYRGSEPGMGWGFVQALAKEYDLCVITEKQEFEADIRRYLLDNPEDLDGVMFEFIPRRRFRWIERLWPPAYYWSYRAWQRAAFKHAKHLVETGHFDVVHQLNMAGFREPGYLWKLPVPYVWGPIGGLGFFPWHLRRSVGRFGSIYYAAYNLVNALHMRWARRPRLAARTAGVGLISATRECATYARELWGVEGQVISEVGVPGERFGSVSSRSPNTPLKIVWSGLHIPRKALDLGLQALANMPEDSQWELHVLGAGGRTHAWQKQAERLGILDHCTFHGWQPRAAALSIMHDCHVMLITSLRDLTATVTIEALALGLPIVCLDHCGFSDAVDETCGIKVPVRTHREVVHGLRDALKRLAEEEDFRHRLAMGATVRAQQFDWRHKAQAVGSIYERKLANHTRKRD